MSVTVETPIASSVANGVTTSFPHSFTVLDSGDLVVTGTLSNVTTTYVLGVDYTLTGVGGSSGSVEFISPPANGTIVTRYRDIPLERSTDYQDNGDLLADTVNLDFDRLWFALQDIFNGGKVVPTCVRAPNGETINALPNAASRAGYFLGFDSLGQPTLLAATAGTAAALSADLANATDSLKGAALSGFAYSLSYALGTAGYVLRRIVFAEAFAQGGDSSNVQAFQRAVDHCAGLGGGVVMTRMTAISFDAACVLKTNVIIQGMGRGKSVITKTAHTFHAFTDNNTLADGSEVHGFSIRCSTAPTTGQTDRAVFIDANSSTARYKFTDLLCENIFRGVNVHQAGTVEYDNVDGLALLDSTVYIGEVTANRTGAVKMGRSFSSASFTDAPGGGGGVIVLAYVDDVTPGYSKFVNCGPSSGAVNLYHGLYLRCCGSADAGYIKASGHKRGAPLHIFADNGAGEPNCGDTVATVVSDGAANYVGVRVDRCDKFILRAGSKISASALQAGYFTNSGPITIEAGVRALNNNGDAVTSAVGSAAWRVSACADFTAVGVVMVDDTSTAGQYGQGCGFAFEGACARYTVDSCQMVFPAAATGYYFISHESGSTVTYPQITNNYTSGPQSFLNEGGTVVPAGQGVMRGNTRDSAANSPLLTVEQLHRWRVQDNWNQGARFNYESDGKNVRAWLTNFPSTDTWVRDDIVYRIDATAAATPGWRCTASGTPGTWKAEANLAA